MASPELSAGAAAPRRVNHVQLTAPSTPEVVAGALAVLSLVLLHAVVVRDYHGGGRMAVDDAPMFVPHLLMLGLIVSGARRVAVALAGLILLAATLVGLASCIVAALRHDAVAQALIALSALQVPLFWACVVAARDASGTPPAPPRLALGALAGAFAWFGVGMALARIDAPRVEGARAIERSLLRHRAERMTRAQFLGVASCLQRSPAGPDSQPLFPAALGELAAAGCAATGPAPAGFAIRYSPGAPDSAGARHAFTLEAHEAPMTDSSRTYTTDETFRIVERYGRGATLTPANAGDPLRALTAAGRCIENARDTATDRYPSTLAAALRAQRCDLRPIADSTALIAYDLHSSYLVRYMPVPDTQGVRAYSLSMEPRREGERMGGFASFLADSAGRVHVTLRARPATAMDPLVPSCPRDWRASREGLPYCLEFLPRQRWGVTSDLPTIGWSRSGSGTVASGDTLHVIPHFRGIVAQDSIVEARIRWRAGEPDSVIRRGPGGIGEPFGDAVVFRLKHVYRDTGYKEIRFTVKTRLNEIYEMRDSVRVLVGWRRP